MSSLGKRSRPPMKKTTSMTEITFDLGEQFNLTASPFPFPSPPQKSDHPFLSPRNYRRHNNSIDLQNSNNFLRVCSLCNRPLVPGRDIYMYRGDNGFCSEECRKKQMKQDERMEKCSFFTTKKSAAVSSSSSSSSSSAASVIPPPQISANGETVAAS